MFSPRGSGYLMPAEVIELISVCIQSEEAPAFHSGKYSARMKRDKQYLSPLCLSLRDLIVAGANSDCIVPDAEGDSVMLWCSSRYHLFFMLSGYCSWKTSSIWSRPRLDLATFWYFFLLYFLSPARSSFFFALVLCWRHLVVEQILV